MLISRAQYLPNQPTQFIVIPRDATKPEQVKFFEWNHCIPTHAAGAYEENGKIIYETATIFGNFFPFFPPEGTPKKFEMDIKSFKASISIFEIDPKAPNESWLPDPEEYHVTPGDFPRIDERFFTQKYQYVHCTLSYCPLMPSCSIVFETIYVPGSPRIPGFGTNGLVRFNHKTRTTDYFWAGPDTGVQGLFHTL